MRHSVTGIYSLTTQFGVSPVYWHWTDSPVVSKYEMVAVILASGGIYVCVRRHEYNEIIHMQIKIVK